MAPVEGLTICGDCIVVLMTPVSPAAFHTLPLGTRPLPGLATSGLSIRTQLRSYLHAPGHTWAPTSKPPSTLLWLRHLSCCPAHLSLVSRALGCLLGCPPGHPQWPALCQEHGRCSLGQSVFD